MNVDLILECEFAHKWIHFHRHYYESGTNNIVWEYKSSASFSSVYGVRGPSFQEDEAYRYLLSEDKKTFRKKYDFDEYPNLIKEQEFIDEWNPYAPFLLKKITIKNGPYLCPTTGVMWRPYKFKREYKNGHEFWKQCRDDYYSEQIFRIKRIPKFEYSWGIETIRDSSRKCYFHSFFRKRPARRPEGTFLPPTIFEWNADKFGWKNPRAFLREKHKAIKKSVIRRCVRKHMNRLLRLGAPSKAQVTFFRSWLGVKELAGLAN